MPIGHLSACYAKEISKQNPCYGHPLSYTKPIRDLEGRKRKVHLGDVGIFEEDGAFRRLFNITVDATHELNGGGVPVGFEPFDLSPKLVCENALSPRILCSEGVEFHEVVDPRIAAMPRWMAESGPRIAIPSTQDGEADSLCTITSNARGGAYLILRDHPTHCWIKSNRELTEYMRRNLASWHAAITDRRQFALKRRLDPEQIFLVRGTIMSSACTIGRIYGEGEIGVPRGLWERACGKVGSVVSMSCAKLGIFRSSLRDGRRERWRNSYAEISYPRDNRPGTCTPPPVYLSMPMSRSTVEEITDYFERAHREYEYYER
ncbi:hypothetical protein BDY19DRAFT_552659 [Irpex rosettiformis]|uniref:Uncharacterized protein n=1 Tax=Irpex rosettiformis TaxID=378272 RepID=A0ACB8TQA3_9APHY|nr:hypothetical protein BDY19DRAFT_552659 [Irpex rosettiformis]